MVFAPHTSFRGLLLNPGMTGAPDWIDLYETFYERDNPSDVIRNRELND